MMTSLGAQLKRIRESRGISLEEISQKTHIRLAYLEDIESDNVQRLPQGPQRRGFLRLYASELGVEIDGKEIEGFQVEPASQEPEIQERDLLPEKPLPESGQVKRDQDEPLKYSDESHESLPDSPQPEISRKQSDPTNSSEVFSELGKSLRSRRDLLSLSIDDIYEHIHIRKRFLAAMEAGNFEQLPSPVQARGMLANYADFLNLDVDDILLQYADGLQMRRLERTEVDSSGMPGQKEAISSTRLKLKNFFSLDLLVIASLFIGFAIFVVWGVNRILTVNNPGTSATDLPEVAEILLATGSPTPQDVLNPDEQDSGLDETGTPAPQEPTPIFTPLPNDNPINIVIIPRQQTWVRVTADEEVVFEGRMLPGNAYDFSGEVILELRTGSAGALQIYFNEQDIGAPGLVGQVVNLIFTEDGLVLPTPTNTPTITQTPETTLTPTPTPSLTPEPSLTPTNIND